MHEETRVAEPNAGPPRGVAPAALLGWLNFSDGRPDPRWQRQLNDAYAALAARGASKPWRALLDSLADGLRTLRADDAPAFRDSRQAEAALALTAKILPAYRRWHADLLAHLDDSELFTPFFLARVFEAVLVEDASGDDEATAVAGVVGRLNDFAGHRPVAILESRRNGELFPHERHRPAPLFLRGAGVGWGRYRDLAAAALEILRAADPAVLAEAQFDPQLLDEFAVDVRAYDHGHPVNRRPNYVFGEWDPHHLDGQGRYRRYVARKVTLDALLDRVANPPPGIDRGELLYEAAAVLAGTVLMATGVSGAGPTAYDSGTTLAVLLPRIARYRDAFYERLLAKLTGPHGDRLRREREATRQPFGAARQHLNAYLAKQRALQLQQRYVSLLFAQMGFADAAREEARRIPTASLRILCEIQGRITAGQVEAERGGLRKAADRLPEVEDLLLRGIACGALPDPWNALGFQGLFPLSPAREDAVRDGRLDELVQSVEQIFNLYARLSSEAAATGDADLAKALTDGMGRLATWWDQFATAEVSDVRRVHGGEAAASARQVAAALAGWRERGEAAADLAFWRDRFGEFRSPKAFALVVDALLHKADFRSAMALLVNWLGQAEHAPLEEGAFSFHSLALRWMLAVTRAGEPNDGGDADDPPASRPMLSQGQARDLVVKFFDYLEANAEENWAVPDLAPADEEEAADGRDDEDVFGAAYEGVTYRDSTDAAEGAVADGGEPAEPFDLEHEAEGLEKRLRFLSTLARLWQVAARFLAASGEAAPVGWAAKARDDRRRLLALLDAVHGRALPEPAGEVDALVEYDRRRVVKEQLLYAAIAACLDVTLAAGALQGDSPHEDHDAPAWDPAARRLERALIRGEPEAARDALPGFVERFQEEPLLFTPLTDGGSPRAILRVRVAQTVLRALLANLPRLGLLRETFDLLRAARAMEQAHPPRGRGVTEFNHFFQAAYQAVVESVVVSAADWPAERGGDGPLVELLERLTAPFLALWVDHSRTLQLSVLETLTGDDDWPALRTFVQRYGNDLFHARFLTLANLRGVLHRGAGAYLDYLREEPDPLRPIRLIDDLGRSVRQEDAVRILTVVLQAVVENYEEYKDYNATTTQSDYGENLHFLLEFLRLKAGYERHAWQYRPLVLAHEVLARRGRDGAAVRWEESLTQFTSELAGQQLDQLARLEEARGLRLSTITDRLQERFVKPLALDRLCALVEPAMKEARTAGERPAFVRLRRELAAYTTTPTGVGLDVPSWLRRLELEVQRVQATQTRLAALAEQHFRVPRRPLSPEEVERQLRDWERPALPR
jgi:hypothetical protein